LSWEGRDASSGLGPDEAGDSDKDKAMSAAMARACKVGRGDGGGESGALGGGESGAVAGG
jgi:hypothetical protein